MGGVVKPQLSKNPSAHAYLYACEYHFQGPQLLEIKPILKHFVEPVPNFFILQK